MEIVLADLDNEFQRNQILSLFHDYFAYGNALSLKAAGITFDITSDSEILDSLEKFRTTNGGQQLLMIEKGHCVGMGAYRDLENGRCEMKRVFIQPHIRGNGFGRKLVETLIHDARSRGYSSMVLESGNYMPEAKKLYESLGFEEIEPYEGSEQGQNCLDCLYYMKFDFTKEKL